MACFTVPVATAVAVSAADKALKNKRNPFVARLGWLAAMLFGGGFLLAIEHVWHGEVVPWPPFLTAVEGGPEAVSEMLHEMATRGVAMSIVVVTAWVAMVIAAHVGERRRVAACAS